MHLISNRTSDILPAQAPKTITVEGRTYQTDEWMNTPSSILDAVSRRLHLQPDHPISITRQLIESRFPGYQSHNDLFPIVSVHQNFDSLGFPAEHPGRNRSDTYYINKDTVLRTHTSAHQADTFRANTSPGYLISADVYRRDAVDRSHYPVFHQMEGAMSWDRNELDGHASLADRIWADVEKLPKHDIKVEDPNPTTHPERNPLQPSHDAAVVEAVATHLKRSLENVVVEIFTQARKAAAAATPSAPTAAALATEAEEPLRVRWVEAYFPFTSPSWELEVFWRDDWLEVLGCGVVQQAILDNASTPDRVGWAFGVGIERIAMLLYSIPDIRLFWSKDPRFLGQFKAPGPADAAIGRRDWAIGRFQPFSKYPATPRDVAFWLPGKVSPKKDSAPSAAGGLMAGDGAQQQQMHENDVMEVVREVAGDVVEDVRLVDEFVHPKKMRKSWCYRIVYRSLERTLTGEEANELHSRVRRRLVERFGVDLR
ncbi:putative phenylalanyl-trna synthetase protein [Neofusicoccum parvum UCRNP2]|uniref:Phenylalanine--tRNA ligase, mitochondrial n=1 Tax=Botryosphaeria parva (strain UCR-NP2) TaxID=1287680 RepID=R1E6A5_BOTPV|nr:putative phenylalanyl-trna synthetase protein [Neofusicoccum parvum UCRNP2]